MENFLLAIIIVMALVIILLVKLMQLIMSFNPYFHAPLPMPSAAAASGPARKGGGIATVIFVLLLVFVLFWLTNPDAPGNNEPSGPEPENRELPMPPVMDTSRNEPAPQKVGEWQAVPVQEQIVDNSEAPVYHYNQRPSRDTLPKNFYAVQLEAFSTSANAARAAKEWKRSLPKELAELVVIVYRPGAIPFKVIAGPFDTRAGASRFRRTQAPKGFITLMDL